MPEQNIITGKNNQLRMQTSMKRNKHVSVNMCLKSWNYTGTKYNPMILEYGCIS